MPQVVGVVERISSKQLASGMYWSFLIEDVWYRTNKDKPPFEEGYKVKFSFEDNQWGKQVDMKSIEFKEGEAPPPRAKGAPKSSSEFWEKKEVRDIETQKRISFQAATNTAISIISTALDKGVIEMPKAKKASDRLEVYKEMIFNETLELYRRYQLVPEDHEGYMGVSEEVVDVSEEPEPEVVEDEW